MTPEAQRIAIAQACGWIRMGETGLYVTKPGMRGWITAPDYLNDLNAMHEAEETLTPFQREAFSLVLFDLMPEDDGYRATIYVPEENEYIGWIEHPADETLKGLHATAAQRAEAFLRTIGKWGS